jgi:hypothetical protein
MAEENNKRILITYNTNWADEMDIQASILSTLKEWNEICEEAKLAFAKYKKCTQYVGTNQDIDYTSYEKWFECYTVKELKPNEYRVLKKFEDLLNRYKFFIPEYYEEDDD